MSFHLSDLSFVFGVLGNICSFFCFLAPIPTFYRVYKKKSTEGFQSIPYVAALFSAMLWIFYAYMKTGVRLLITINVFGCVIETIYIVIYVTYCPKKARMLTVKMIMLLNFVGFSAIVGLIYVVTKEEEKRVKLLGWICVVFATSVFAAPLSIITVVIRTRSVEFLPFQLSVLLLISAIMWLLYGVSLRDIYVTLPNVVGLIFGVLQIALYAMYRKNKPIMEDKLPEYKGDITVNNESVVLSTVTHEKQEVKTVEAGDIKIGEQQTNSDEEKNNHDQAKPINNINYNKKIEEMENCHI